MSLSNDNNLDHTAEVLAQEIFQQDYAEVQQSDFELLSTIRYDPNLSQNVDSSLQETISRNIEHNWTPDDLLFEENVGSTSPLTSSTDITSLRDSEQGASVEDLEQVFYSRFFLLGEHLIRIQFSLQFFSWDCDISMKLLLRLLINALPATSSVSVDDNTDSITEYKNKMLSLIFEKDCYKMRVLINKDGEIRVEAHALPRSPPLALHQSTDDYFLRTLLSGFLNGPPTWTVYIYDKCLIPSPFTSFKTTKREHYNLAREKLQELHKGKEGPAEILLFNKSKELMEGTITNCYVSKNVDEKRVYETPALSSGCLTGVMRHFLVSKRLVRETKNINIDTLKDGDEVLLSNGIMGLVKGVLVRASQ
ncbi:hypothetical protein ACO0QE_001659 [Hanseniaspora vineae]